MAGIAPERFSKPYFQGGPSQQGLGPESVEIKKHALHKVYKILTPFYGIFTTYKCLYLCLLIYVKIVSSAYP